MFLFLIHRPMKISCTKTQTLPNLRLPISSADLEGCASCPLFPRNLDLNSMNQLRCHVTYSDWERFLHLWLDADHGRESRFVGCIFLDMSRSVAQCTWCALSYKPWPGTTGRSNWIQHRKLKYSICCLRDPILRIVRDLSNSIKDTTGGKFT